MSELAVLKFGGTSAAEPERMATIATEDRHANRVIMVSAIGKDPSDPASEKVTDMLLQYETAANTGDQQAMLALEEAVIERYRSAYDMLGSETTNRLVNQSAGLFRQSRPEDGYAWIGEAMSGSFFSRLIDAQHATSQLRFDENGSPLMGRIFHRMQRKTQEAFGSAGNQLVMDTFYGYREMTGRVDTLGRGGSDIGAIMCAAALKSANPFERWLHLNYTDKDGVLSADPRIVPDARPIAEATFEEIREMSHGVFERNGVIHGDAVAYGERYDVPIIVKNTFNPAAPGTRISRTRTSDSEHPVIGLSGRSGVNSIEVYDTGMDDTPGYIAAASHEVDQNGLSIGDMPTSRDRLKIVLNGGEAETPEALEATCRAIQRHATRGNRARVRTVSDEAQVYIVGQEMVQQSGRAVRSEVLGRALTAMAQAGLEVRDINSLSSSPSTVVTVAGFDLEPTIQTLHSELIR